MSRLAWFRAAPPDTADLLDETAPIVDALRRHHHIDIVTAADAHDFVWRHFREPYDVCVYELGSTPAHAFMRAYLPHHPGIIAPRGLGVGAAEAEPRASGGGRSEDRPLHGPEHRGRSADRPLQELTVGLLEPSRLDVVQQAVARARQSGADVTLLPTATPETVLRDADVIVACEWPPLPGPPTPALLGMAARKAVIALEVEATAVWPALDPQTWVRRGYSDETPVVVTVDPRDEEHSLMRALTRLAADAALRVELAAAAQAWWRNNATLDHALRAWERMLEETPPAPSRAARDGSEHARVILSQFGVTVDLMR